MQIQLIQIKSLMFISNFRMGGSVISLTLFMAWLLVPDGLV